MAEQSSNRKSTKKSFLQEFKEFINQGSVIDLAVGIVIGGAFTAIVNSLVNDIIMPLIGLIMGGVNLSSLSFTVGEATVNYGNFIQNVLDFLIVAFSIFLVIKAMNKMRQTSSRECKELLTKTKAKLKKKN